MCRQLRTMLPDLNVADNMGCPMRLIMAPKSDFVVQLRFDFRNGDSVKPMTISEIVTLLSQYFVIGIHLRLGDFAFKSGQTAKLDDNFNDVWQNPLRCAHTLEWQLANENKPSPAIEGKAKFAPLWNSTLSEFRASINRIQGVHFFLCLIRRLGVLTFIRVITNRQTCQVAGFHGQ